MKADSVNTYRRLLLALAARVRADSAGMFDQAHSASGGKGGSELSNAPMHLGDMGTEEFLYDINVTLLANEQHIASEILVALDRINNGTFGVCESCVRPIAPERLDEIPYTRFCVTCAATQNNTPQVNLDEGRPHSPEDTLAPEGEMEEDHLHRSDPLEFPPARVRRGDIYAAGTAGGGTALGGLAGCNQGNGDPVIAELDEATGSSNFDATDDRADDRTPQSGFTGGAVGGTPARKRSK